MWLPLTLGMTHLAYRNTNASLVGEQPLPGQMTNGTTKAARKARVARAQCKQQFDAWRADPSNCNLQPFYFCNLHISFDVPRLEAVLNRAAELTGCAGRDNVDEDAGRQGKKERRSEGFSEKTKMREQYHNYRLATSGGWPRPGARWCPAMGTGQEVSPWNSSIRICHDLAWPPDPVSSDVQIQLNSLVYVHHGFNASASGQKVSQYQSKSGGGGGGQHMAGGLHDKSNPALCTEKGLILKNPSLVRRLGKIELRLGDESTVMLSRARNAVGLTSIIYTDAQKRYVLKLLSAKVDNNHDPIQREACVLKELQIWPWSPKLMCHNSFAVVTTHVGTRFTPHHLAEVPDYARQVKRIISDMEALGVEHHDLIKLTSVQLLENMQVLTSLETPPKKRKDLEYEIRSGWMYGTELMVREGELSMVDFGWASLRGDFTCRGRLSATIPDHFNKTVPYRKDRAIFILLNLWRMVTQAPGLQQQDLELHLIVLWNTTHPDAASTYEQALDEFGTSIVATEMHAAYSTSKERISRLTRFYEKNLPPGFMLDDARGRGAFLLIYLKLTKSQYGPCRGGASGRGLTSCPLTNQFKSSVRTKIPTLLVHATDSVTETTDNLNALGLSYASRFGVHRASWNSLEDVLHALDAVCDYVMLRDFEGYTRDARVPKGGEVDLLTSDFTKAMIVLGRVPAVAPWQMVGSGGDRASLSVIVGGFQVKFHVRHIGDGYMDPQWAARVLQRRVFWNAGGFYVPCKTDHFYIMSCNGRMSAGVPRVNGRKTGVPDRTSLRELSVLQRTLVSLTSNSSQFCAHAARKDAPASPGTGTSYYRDTFGGADFSAPDRHLTETALIGIQNLNDTTHSVNSTQAKFIGASRLQIRNWQESVNVSVLPGAAPSAELHLLIFWRPSAPASAAAYDLAVRRFHDSIVGETVHLAFGDATLSATKLTEFYRANVPVGYTLKRDPRGREPFVVLFLRLLSSSWTTCRGGVQRRRAGALPANQQLQDASTNEQQGRGTCHG